MAGSSEKTAPRRGRGRPFQPGQSGNPSGRPRRQTELAAAFREFATEGDLRRVYDRLMKIVDKGKDRDVIPAARELLDRTLGKATQPLALTGAEGGPVEVDVEQRSEVKVDASPEGLAAVVAVLAEAGLVGGAAEGAATGEAEGAAEGADTPDD